jgi:hypothetical protein
MREDDSDILEYSIIKYQPASFLGLNGYYYSRKLRQLIVTNSKTILYYQLLLDVGSMGGLPALRN